MTKTLIIKRVGVFLYSTIPNALYKLYTLLTARIVQTDKRWYQITIPAAVLEEMANISAIGD